VKIKGGVELWPIGGDTAKAKIYARLKIDEPGPGCLHFPLGLPDEYYQQLTAERLVTRYHKGYLVHEWEKDAGERNEPLDLEVYAYAAAIYAGVTRINWDRLEAALRATAGDLFVQAQKRRRGARRPPSGAPPEPKKPAAAARPDVCTARAEEGRLAAAAHRLAARR
jgi:phage terminase large subunit GpA-like protein